jgi:hypothetical protein
MPDGVGQEERGRKCPESRLLVNSTSCRYLEGSSSDRRMGRAWHFCHRQRQGIRSSTVDVSITTQRDFGATIQADRSKFSTPTLTVKSISPTASRAPRSLSGTLAVPLKSAGGWVTERSPESQR